MISVAIRRKEGRIDSFTVTDHSKSDICAAVSILTLNTVNSIEALTDEVFVCEYDPDGGYLSWERKGNDPGANLLLEAMAMGLWSVKENYSSYIELTDEG